MGTLSILRMDMSMWKMLFIKVKQTMAVTLGMNCLDQMYENVKAVVNGQGHLHSALVSLYTLPHFHPGVDHKWSKCSLGSSPIPFGI